MRPEIPHPNQAGQMVQKTYTFTFSRPLARELTTPSAALCSGRLSFSNDPL